MLIPKKSYYVKLKFLPFNKLSKINNKFTFLNQSIDFKNIDWDYNEYGKLWTYNLNYMDYLV